MCKWNLYHYIKMLPNYILLLLAFAGLISAQQNWTAKYLPELQGSLDRSIGMYDGKDSIFLFENWRAGRVQHFRISTGQISTIYNGSYEPSLSGVWGLDGQIYLFGGYDHLFRSNPYNRVVQKFNPLTNQLSFLTQLPCEIPEGFALKRSDNSDEVLLLGAEINTVRTDLIISTTINGNWSCDPVGRLPSADPRPTSFKTLTTGILTQVTLGRHAYIVGNGSAVRKLNLDTLDTEVLYPRGFPFMDLFPSMVTDGNNIYIFGGYRLEEGNPLTQGVIKLNPLSMDWDIIHVTNYPVKDPHWYWMAPTAVYVKKLNRIYLLGGYSLKETGYKAVIYKHATVYNDVFYFDLSK